jgi:DNA-binding transcriptional ArsR family regulator
MEFPPGFASSGIDNICENTHMRKYANKAADMAGRASDASDLLRTLASPHRLMIVCRLIEGDQCVGGLAADLDLQQTLVSQHLAILRRQRVVEAKRVGQTIATV